MWIDGRKDIQSLKSASSVCIQSLKTAPNALMSEMIQDEKQDTNKRTFSTTLCGQKPTSLILRFFMLALIAT